MSTETVMSVSSDTTEVILVRLEGKIDRMVDRVERYERDLDAMRTRIHELSNRISPLMMMDLPARIRVWDTAKAETDSRVQTLENIEQQRKGAANLVRILWLIVGGVSIGGVASVLRLLQVGGF